MPTYFFDPHRLREIASSHSRSFQQAEPFPHVVIDDFVPEHVIGKLQAEFPSPGSNSWQRYVDGREAKLATNRYEELGPFTRHLLTQFNGPTIVGFLEGLTGITGLVGDPWFDGGGLHQIERGGFLKVHADFSSHDRLHLQRRLNAILYLNRDWDPDWGGQLELWDRQMTQAIERIDPIAGRLVVFATDSWSHHGHPDPLMCPPDRQRRSMALYYYTVDRPAADGTTHSTLFQRRPGERFASPFSRQSVKQFVPPIVVDIYRRSRERMAKRRLKHRE